jgi:6-phosphogluconolactonase (cycloisomerase 2 family)
MIRSGMAGIWPVRSPTADPTAGQLVPLTTGYVEAGQGPRGMAIHPSGRFVYVINDSDFTISLYTTEPTTGKLTLQDSMITGIQPSAIAIHPFGHVAYVTIYLDVGPPPTSHLLYLYSIEATTGQLTPLNPSSVAVGYLPESVAVDPTGRFVYVANRGSSDVSMFSMDATSGTLRPLQPGRVDTRGDPQSVTVDPSGRFAYAANSFSNSVLMYRIEATSGQLIPQAFSGTGERPLSVTVDPTGRFAYVANYDSNDVSMYSIDPTSGELIALEPERVKAGVHPLSVRVDSFSQFAYVANYHSKDVSMYRIEPTSGQLIALEPSCVETGSGPTVVTTTNPFDYQVQQDMLTRAGDDARFGAPWYGTFGQDLASDPEWEVRGMSFAFAGGRAVFMVHATSKINRSRWTNYQDPDTGQLAGWEPAV